jgi:hypothetical protein
VLFKVHTLQCIGRVTPWTGDKRVHLSRGVVDDLTRPQLFAAMTPIESALVDVEVCSKVLMVIDTPRGQLERVIEEAISRC